MKDWTLIMLAIILSIIGVSSCMESEFYKEFQMEEREKEKRAYTPEVIREVDGCKVYTFRDNGKWHYFTRCPDSKTSTEGTQSECHLIGKVMVCNDIQEKIDNE